MTSILTITAEDIIEGAALKARVVPLGSVIPPAVHEHILKELNYILEGLQTDGYHLWTKTEGVVFLTTGTNKFSLGVDGDHSSTSFLNLTATSAILSAAVAIPVVTADMTIGDFIGIELDDGTRQWTTIKTIDSAAQATVNDALTDDVASGNTIFSYTTKLDRPVRVIDGRSRRVGSDTELILYNVSRQDYFEQSAKSTQSAVTNFYYSPQLSTGELYVWPRSDNVKQYLDITFIRPINIVENNSDSVDIPSEWARPLIYQLASSILPDFKNDPIRQALLDEKAFTLMDKALGFDHEFASLEIGVQ